MNPKTLKKLKFAAIGLVVAVFLYFLIGLPADLIPNPLFVRMVPATAVDGVFLVLISALLGTFVAVYFYKRGAETAKADAAAGRGGFIGIVAVNCPVCYPLLVSIFGATALYAFLEPLRIPLGIASVALISYAIYAKLNCAECERN